LNYEEKTSQIGLIGDSHKTIGAQLTIAIVNSVYKDKGRGNDLDGAQTENEEHSVNGALDKGGKENESAESVGTGGESPSIEEQKICSPDGKDNSEPQK
tara:strand:- start:421 stop:717 length:297 start_codon:yes stop_codon:yes gene_type:complete